MADVNRPTDVKQKDADINRKLQVYGIIQAFQNGKLPSNDQVDVALNSFLASKALSSPSQKLSAEGRVLVADVRDVVDQAKRLVLSKNDGNLLQDFVWQTTHFDPSSTSTPNAPLDKEAAKQHGDKALEGLKTLGTLIITNGQFRKLLQDTTVLIRDMAGDAATSAAARVRPSDEALAGMDDPAADNTWHEAPDLSKDNIKKQAQSTFKRNAASNGDVVAAEPGEKVADPTAGTVDVNGIRDAAQAGAREQRARVKAYLQKKMPQERRDQTIWRLKKMVLECQQHPDYQQAIGTLLDLAEEYGGHAKTVGSAGAGTVQDARSSTPLRRAEADLKTLLERCANGTSTDPLWDSINTIYRDADQDPELKDWFRAMDKYMRRCLQEQGYVLDDASTREWNRLYDRGNYLLRDKYRGHTDAIADETRFLLTQFDEDEQNKAFAVSLKKLFNDLGNDENGKPTFKPHLVKDLAEVIIPAVFESVAYIPVPRIEYSDPGIDAVIENLVLESDNFMPNVLEVASENFFRWGRKNIASKNKHAIDVKIAGVQMDLRDVSYHVRRKQGFPHITDTGVANLTLAKEGLTFRLKMSSAGDGDRQNFLRVEKVDVDVKHLKITLSKSRHKLLFNAFRPLMVMILRPAMQKAIEKAIKDNVDKFDNMLYQIKCEADRALDETLSDPDDMPNVYRRYLDATKLQVLRGKEKAGAAVADKKLNYAMTTEDSIFPNIKLPGGISTKATEYKELARQGEGWESPVFSIGSASKSSDTPSPPKVVRKTRTGPTTTPRAKIGENGSLDHSLAARPTTLASA